MTAPSGSVPEPAERTVLHRQAAAAFAEVHGLMRTKRQMAARLNELRDAEEEFERQDDPGVYWRHTPDGQEYARLYRKHDEMGDSLSDLMLVGLGTALLALSAPERTS